MNTAPFSASAQPVQDALPQPVEDRFAGWRKTISSRAPGGGRSAGARAPEVGFQHRPEGIQRERLQRLELEAPGSLTDQIEVHEGRRPLHEALDIAWQESPQLLAGQLR